MSNTTIDSNFGLIGDRLELKKNISIELDENGKIIEVLFDNISEDITFSKQKQITLLIPGFINSHVHICDSFAKEQGFNKDLIETVAPPNGIKHVLLSKISKEIKMHGIREAALEMLASGITMFFDFRENGLSGVALLKEALQKSPINYRILGRFNDTAEIEPVLKSADGLGFASYDQLSSENKEIIRSLKREYLVKIVATHDAELSRDEILFNQIINDQLIDVIIHGTHYRKDDLERLKRNNISLVLCPRCNGYFGSGFPPINEIYDLGIPISLGTDNVMANNIDLFEEMRYLYRISRVLAVHKNCKNLSSKDLLEMVTITAARNFGLEKEYGSISEGKYADFFLVDLSDPNYYTYKIDSESIYNIIVQRTKSENIKKTYIKGVVEFERK
jgi:cytosine/adenosine deaminase-related metal-dependent hydrolase